MGRKKALDGLGGGAVATGGGARRGGEEPLELKPFCYYCDREFDTVKTLIQHQRTKHFNCSECGLKFDTVTGLRVHMLNSYKRTMKTVPDAIPGRENPDVVVHGMEGLPKSIVEDRTKKALAEQAERQKEKAERAAARAAERPVLPDLPPLPAAPAPLPSNADVEDAPPLPPSAPIALPPDPPRPMQKATSFSISAASASTANAAVAVAVAAPPPVAVPTMPNLSPAVARLLAGSSSSSSSSSSNIERGDGDKEGGSRHSTMSVSVRGRPDIVVPQALCRLHPIALQMLASAGVLQPKGGLGGLAMPPGPSTSLGSFTNLSVVNARVVGIAGPNGLEPDEKRQRLVY